MRHISMEDFRPDTNWVKKASDLLDDLTNATNKAARDKIIDDNTKLWGELKQALLELSHGKCWFSEAKDCFSHFDVEHFRPKKSAIGEDETDQGGYWWLSFDWRNLRICGNAGNRKKGTKFPVKDEGRRCKQPTADLRFELPHMLDPADPDDPALISFDPLGQAIPNPALKSPANDWDICRANYSIEHCKLDFGPLEEKRKTVWNDCDNEVKEYLENLAKFLADPDNLVAKEAHKGAAKRIRKMMRPEQELSTIARTCVESRKDDRLRSLILTY